jgi:hypothetical protein
MIIIESIITKFKRVDKFMNPIMNVTCMKCKNRWSHDVAYGKILCMKCANEITIEKALENLTTRFKTYGKVT